MGIRVVSETRIQVSSSRVRILDLCIIEAGRQRERVNTHPALLYIEVLSPRDSMQVMRSCSQDYLDVGVPEVWIFDPASRTAYVYTSGAMTEHKIGSLKLPGSPVEISRPDVFATLDA